MLFKKIFSRAMIKFFISLLIALPVFHSTVFAADEEEPWVEPSSVVTKMFRTEDGWLMTYIRGDAAKLIFEGLDVTLEKDVTRKDGSIYKARSASHITCTFSTKFANRARHLCAFATKQDGTMSEVTADPEMGGTASIGGSN